MTMHPYYWTAIAHRVRTDVTKTVALARRLDVIGPVQAAKEVA